MSSLFKKNVLLPSKIGKEEGVLLGSKKILPGKKNGSSVLLTTEYCFIYLFILIESNHTIKKSIQII